MKQEIKGYSQLQHDLHKKIMKLITNKKFRPLIADECMVVFGRIYAVWCLDELVKRGELKIKKKGKKKWE